MRMARATLIFCLLVSGCGYQLRGSDYWTSLPPVAVAEVREPALKAAQVVLAKSLRSNESTESSYSVVLVDETYQKWPIAASPLDAVINYRVTLRWSVDVLGPDGGLVFNQTAQTADRFVEQRSNLLAAGEAEERRLNQLRVTLADQVMRQISQRLAKLTPTPPVR